MKHNKIKNLTHRFGSFSSTSNNFLSQYPFAFGEARAFFITLSISLRRPAGSDGSVMRECVGFRSMRSLLEAVCRELDEYMPSLRRSDDRRREDMIPETNRKQ